MKRKRRPYRPRGAARGSARRSAAPAAAALTAGQLRVVVCGAVFTLLVGLKLMLPGGMAAARSALGAWLTRDADFVSAFSAVGRAVSGADGALDALGDAYVAVFGTQRREAAEASGAAEAAEPSDTRDYPDHALAEQRVLGFDYIAPLAGTVTSPFGWREHPATGRESFHYGVDLAAEEGAPIVCFADGTVGVVGESVELGKYVTVHHDGGVTTLYAHCSRVTARPGETVALGGKLAEAGSTGNATGTHLHFEIQDGEDYLNPAYYL